MANSRSLMKDATTRHSIFVQRFAGSQLKQMVPHLERARELVVERLKGAELTTLSRARLGALLTELNAELASIYAEMAKELRTGVNDFAEYEASFSQRMFSKYTEADFILPAPTTLQAAALYSPVSLIGSQAGSVNDLLNTFEMRKRQQIINVLQDGVITGRTNEELARDISFLTKRIQRREAKSLAVTVTNNISTIARDLTIRENRELVEEVEWVSTLDGRTSSTCQALDGQRFPIDSGPRPPQHWGCRSTVIPVVKPEYTLREPGKGTRPSVGEDGAEQVSAQTTYGGWLKKQSTAFQDEVLGPARGKLFRNGGLSVDSFVDNNYRPLTLAELRQLEPLAFEKAGLSPS